MKRSGIETLRLFTDVLVLCFALATVNYVETYLNHFNSLLLQKSSWNIAADCNASSLTLYCSKAILANRGVNVQLAKNAFELKALVESSGPVDLEQLHDALLRYNDSFVSANLAKATHFNYLNRTFRGLAVEYQDYSPAVAELQLPTFGRSKSQSGSLTVLSVRSGSHEELLPLALLVRLGLRLAHFGIAVGQVDCRQRRSNRWSYCALWKHHSSLAVVSASGHPSCRWHRSFSGNESASTAAQAYLDDFTAHLYECLSRNTPQFDGRLHFKSVHLVHVCPFCLEESRPIPLAFSAVGLQTHRVKLSYILNCDSLKRFANVACDDSNNSADATGRYLLLRGHADGHHRRFNQLLELRNIFEAQSFVDVYTENLTSHWANFLILVVILSFRSSSCAEVCQCISKLAAKSLNDPVSIVVACAAVFCAFASWDLALLVSLAFNCAFYALRNCSQNAEKMLTPMLMIFWAIAILNSTSLVSLLCALYLTIQALDYAFAEHVINLTIEVVCYVLAFVLCTAPVWLPFGNDYQVTVTRFFTDSLGLGPAIRHVDSITGCEFAAAAILYFLLLRFLDYCAGKTTTQAADSASSATSESVGPDDTASASGRDALESSESLDLAAGSQRVLLIQSNVQEISKVYISDQCIVCLESDPDFIPFMCGHKCLHRSCYSLSITQCPLCRDGRFSWTLKILNLMNRNNES